MADYVVCRWIDSDGREKEAQSDRGSYAIENYAGIGVGSGKLLLDTKYITERDFIDNKARGMKTV